MALNLLYRYEFSGIIFARPQSASLLQCMVKLRSQEVRMHYIVEWRA